MNREPVRISQPIRTAVQGTRTSFELDDEPAFSGLFMTYLLARDIWIEADLVDQRDREHSCSDGGCHFGRRFSRHGEKWSAIPINRINLAGEARFTIDMSNKEVRNAPAFDFVKLK